MDVRELGQYIRKQRENSRLTLRNLSGLTGISGPYLSQVERGLRKPSADILQGIAKGLRISAETLYVQAGILEDRPVADVASAIMSDPTITERQKQALVQIYESFRDETSRSVGDGTKSSATLKARPKAVVTKPRVATKKQASAATEPPTPKRAKTRTSKEA